MSTVYDQRQRYRLYLAPDSGPIIPVEVDGQRVAAQRMMSVDSAVDEIIRQIRTDSRYRDQVGGLRFDDPRARASLQSILPHMQVIHGIAGMVVAIPGNTSAPAGSGGAGGANGQTPDDIRRISAEWQKKLDDLARQHEKDKANLQAEYARAVSEARQQAQGQHTNDSQRITTLEGERDRAVTSAETAKVELDALRATQNQGNQDSSAEISRLNGELLQKDAEISRLTAVWQTAKQQEDEARDKERTAREETNQLRERIAHMEADERQRRANNLNQLAGGQPNYPDPGIL